MDYLRQMLRFQGLRCHIMYCRNSTRLQIIPLLASRSQALRYCISVLSSVYMFVSFIMLFVNYSYNKDSDNHNHSNSFYHFFRCHH